MTEAETTETKKSGYDIESNLKITGLEIRDPVLKAALNYFAARDGVSVEIWLVRAVLPDLEII
jgi:hypothetical protein